jgi:hypothetical protein
MTLAATFLGGAKSRLLPASIPFRFFIAAAIFHVAMWLALIVGVNEATGFRGGLGPSLAAVHLLTLGVSTTTAIGASVQLLPVATRRVLASITAIKLVFWLVVPGLTVLVVGMDMAATTIMFYAAVITASGLILYAALLANNLWRAGSLPVVAGYGWTALACLVLLLALGVALAADYEFGGIGNHAGLALAHVLLGGFGFMGMLVLGFSHILIPMFTLSASPARMPASAGLGIAVIALATGTAGAVLDNINLLAGAGLLGLAAAGIHLWLMFQTLKTGMRKRLGYSFLLIRSAWVMLPATLLVGLATLFGYAGSNGPTLFGFFLIFGWLLTFLLGILQRILPFLASMHVSKGAGSTPPLMSELTASAPLKLHAICHGFAFVILALSITTDSGLLMLIASVIGLIGALAFAWFTWDVSRRVFFAA